MGIYFSICSFAFMIIIMFIFVGKTVIYNVETTIYRKLIYITLIGLFLEIFTGFIYEALQDTNRIFYIILSKLTVSYYAIWTMYFNNYLLNICSYKKTNNFLYNFLTVIVLMLALVLPLEFVTTNGQIFPSGLAVYFAYFVIIVFTILNILLAIKYRKTIPGVKLIPLYFLLVFGMVGIIFGMIFPGTLIFGFILSLIDFIMYFTIENPDVAMLEEFKTAKNRAEKANEEKEIFLYDITQNIRMPLNDIKRASSWLDSNASDITVNDIHDGTYYINNKATSILDKVNNVLDITNMELTNIKVYQSKYDVGNIIDYIKKTYKSVGGINLIYTIDSNIPKELYGDSLRLKQLLSILMDNAFKYTDEGSIELKLNTIVKKDVCRLIITVEDTGCGIKASEIDSIFNKDNQLYNNLDKIDDSKKNLAIAKSIANLLGGILLLDSEIGKGTKITLVLDQTIYKEKSSELNKLEEDAEKYIDKKNVMVVVEDAEYMAKVLKKLSKYDINAEAIDKGAKCIERIRLKHKYDLIIMDEMLRDLSSLEILKKLQKITNFNTPICLLTDNIENENFISEGFKYLVDKKLTKKDLDNLIKEIV